MPCVAVARSGSISGGAKLLGVQHSTVSRRVHKLEEDLGTRLFEKKRLGYELTVVGERLQAPAVRMEQEALGVNGALLGRDTKLTGHCFMGDPDPTLERYSDPNPEWNLGLWLLLHPDLKRTARVLAFRDHMLESIKAEEDLFEGQLTG